jgi:hypothetical protein
MKCREFDAHLTEYLDDCLSADERRSMDQHLLSCEACMEAHEEAAFAWNLLREAPLVEPPPQLIADIIHDTIGIGTGALAPAGGGLWGFLQPILNPFLEPRFVMGMAMTVVSFSMLSYHGQRAFENWRHSEPSPLVQMATSTSERAESAWQRLTDMATAAQDFYELQVGAEDPQPAVGEGSN